MNLKKLAVLLCKAEGKKKQVNIAQMSETLKCLRRIIKENPVPVLRALLK
jgi:hypothetical protein